MRIHDLIRWLLALLLLLAANTNVHAATAGNGDINGDGRLSPIDFNILRNYLIGKATISPSQAISADLNGDGRFDVADLLKMRTIIPSLLSFNINNGTSYTLDRNVILNNTCQGLPSQYMASESATFTDAIWQHYSSAPSYLLSAGKGVKQVYFKVRNLNRESDVLSHTIKLIGQTVSLNLPGQVPLVMIKIPAGSFQMGSPDTEINRHSDEGPTHQVTLTKNFFLSQELVTQKQWIALTGKNPSYFQSMNGYYEDLNRPVEMVSWDGIAGPGGFIQKMNLHLAATGQDAVVRLPTEAEWEYACRAGTTTRFFFGDSQLAAQDGAQGDGPTDGPTGSTAYPGRRSTYMWFGYDLSTHQTHIVGMLYPNAWGLRDMAGNLWEWCQDWYGPYASDAAVDPVGQAGTLRVMRGGAWLSDARFCRSANRYFGYPSERNHALGFRLAAEVTIPSYLPAVTRFSINSNAASTTISTVSLANLATGKPSDFQVSETPGFVGAAWIPYTTITNYALSAGYGPKTVWFKVRNWFGESAATSATITVNGDRVIEMVNLAQGTYLMGNGISGDDGYYGNQDEWPPHQVTVPACQIGKYEITNGQYAVMLNWALGKGYLKDSLGAPYQGGDIYAGGQLLAGLDDASQIVYANGGFIWKTRDGYSMENHPMLNVTWYGGVAFCNWLSEKEEKPLAYNPATWELIDNNSSKAGIQYTHGYRLPTEAEWEKAAASVPPSFQRYIYGFQSDTLAGDFGRCNYFYNDYVNPLNLTQPPFTSPVGWFNGLNVSPKGNAFTYDSPSPSGCYDMSGNAWEWCQDWFHLSYDDAPGDGSSWETRQSANPFRVIRGGGWPSIWYYCRTACRGFDLPNNWDDALGFRVARTP